MRKVNRILILANGSKMRLFLKPCAARVRLVINKFVKDIVVLTPAKITAIIKTSCAPKAVYFILDEYGVMKVQPEVVAARLEHLVK